MRVRFAIFILCIGFCGASEASDVEHPLSAELLKPFSVKTLTSDFTSPFTTDAKYVFIFGTIATSTVLIFRNQLENSFNNELSEDRPLGHSNYGNVIGMLVPNVSYYLGSIGLAYLTDDSNYARRANLMLRATLHSGISSTILKATVREGRPYNENVKTSFPSGHTTTTFAFASVVAMEHPWYWGLAAYSLAAYVGLSRVNDHQHYLHDVLAGATIGISYGIGVCLQDRLAGKVAADRGPFSVSYALLPSDDLKGATLDLSASF